MTLMALFMSKPTALLLMQMAHPFSLILCTLLSQTQRHKAPTKLTEHIT